MLIMVRKAAAAGLLGAGLMLSGGATLARQTPVQPACGQQDAVGALPSGSASAAAGWTEHLVLDEPYASRAHVAFTGPSSATLFYALYGGTTLVRRTVDGGRTWSEVARLDGFDTPSVASSGRTIDLLSATWYIHSDDAGLTWTRPRALSGLYRESAIARDDRGAVLVAYWTQQALYVRVSLNGGHHFHSAIRLEWFSAQSDGCAAPGPLMPVVGISNGALLVTSPSAHHLYRSTNGGVSWTMEPRLRARQLVTHGRRVLAIGGGEIRVSDDRGLSWSEPLKPFDGSHLVGAFSHERWRIAFHTPHSMIRYTDSKDGRQWVNRSTVAGAMPGQVIEGPATVGWLAGRPTVLFGTRLTAIDVGDLRLALRD